jgi:hypothetical protein
LLANAKTAMDGLSRPDGNVAGPASGNRAPLYSTVPRVVTLPTKRKPRRGTVRIRTWRLPLSPIAALAERTRLAKVASETNRPSQITSNNSSFDTNRVRFSTRN